MHYVYILKKLGKFYIGYTENLIRRLKKHQLEGSAVLIYYEAYLSKKLAINR